MSRFSFSKIIIIIVAIEDIYEVFSVEDIKQKQEEGMLTTSSASWGGSGSTQPQSFTGIVYAYLTTLNITSDDTSAVVCYRWLEKCDTVW